jgi:hypothetical protein
MNDINFDLQFANWCEPHPAPWGVIDKCYYSLKYDHFEFVISRLNLNYVHY